MAAPLRPLSAWRQSVFVTFKNQCTKAQQGEKQVLSRSAHSPWSACKAALQAGVHRLLNTEKKSRDSQFSKELRAHRKTHGRDIHPESHNHAEDMGTFVSARFFKMLRKQMTSILRETFIHFHRDVCFTHCLRP
jgi:hypothetical protein